MTRLKPLPESNGQSKRWQEDYLALHRETGWKGIFWYVQAVWQFGAKTAAAVYPGVPWIPVIPVAPDPLASRRLGEMLASLYQKQAEKGHTFRLALTDEEHLNRKGAGWYVWSAPAPVTLQAVCEWCGAVDEVCYTRLELPPYTWLCEACAARASNPRRKPNRKSRAPSTALPAPVETLASWLFQASTFEGDTDNGKDCD